MAGDPGRKNRKITLKSQAVTNPNGEVTETLSTFATVWADFRPLRMDERFSSEARHSVRAGNFRIYYRDDVTPDTVIGFDGLNWKVLGVAEVGFRDELDITAEVVYGG